MHKVIVIGGGAAGLFAAYASAQQNNQVVLIEKNNKLGKKIYITGKGRCNLSNAVSVEDFLKNVLRNPKFLMSSINFLSPQKTMELFEQFGLKLKIERGNRVFPESDKASDVTSALEKQLKKLNVDIMLETTVLSVQTKQCDDSTKVIGVHTDKGFIDCDSVIVCTGGVSYPLTGSTGDGYLFAEQLGHKTTERKPSLTGLELLGSDFAELQGLYLKNVAISIKNANKTIYSDFGEMLFAHFGVSGPIILSSSAFISRLDVGKLDLFIDLKPALDTQTLNNRLLREFEENKNKTIDNALRALLPKSLISLVLRRSNVNTYKKCCEITKEQRNNLISTLKGLSFKIKKLRPIEEAIVTSGGVCVNEINPKTMQSKIVKGLFFAGEVLDIDAYTGGFNLQIAFSTGYSAGYYS